MAKYRTRIEVVEAVQLLWTTWDEVCKLADVGKLADGHPEGCYVEHDVRKVTEDSNGRIGLKIPSLDGLLLAVEGDWIVRAEVDGAPVLFHVPPNAFSCQFDLVLDED
jgi:hypothetical protein